MGCTNSKINKYTYDTTTPFSFNNKNFEVRVIDIYDGDTCTVVFKIMKEYYSFKIRLANIDTSELKSQNEQTKQLAYKARARLFELITGFRLVDINISRKEMRNILNEKVYKIKLVCGNFEKYGRILGTLYSITNKNSQSFNNILVEEKLAYVYNGGTKLSEEEQIEIS